MDCVKISNIFLIVVSTNFLLGILIPVPVSAAAAHDNDTQQSCQVAQLQCHARSGCQMALNNFFIHCSSLIASEENYASVCPTDCKHALVSLLSTEDNTGHAFINCDCGNKKMCVERKRKVQICQKEVLDSMHVLREDAPPVTCNLARYICEADTSCLAALRYYYDHCSRLFKGIRCSSRCKNSLRILSRQQHAKKLRHCMCDGSEDYDCNAVKANTEQMCFHKKKNYESSSSGSPDAAKKARARRRLRRRKRRNQALKNWRKANRKRRRQRREERKKKNRMKKLAAHGK
ncbi:growth arrest-specific protein 1-like protein [Plakobranchus ocellatus]|uniref:Growth arrest-specific protein 1-like protein n=1 Tax=Plakobranchus ocellatus TaxID=259542 RepID=A0AAV4CQS3_9GAST|nr:growth arrest-specific protein 1-like protein [Plakobranchus ocellatus]